MSTKRAAVVACMTIACMALPAFAQQSKTVAEGPIVIKELKHDTGPLLREIAPLLPEFGAPSEREIENNVNPNHNWSNQRQKDPVLQTAENSPTLQSPGFDVEFDGMGYGGNFFCNCMPPDNDGAPGTTQYVQYINKTYEVFDKSGKALLGPLSGNSLWSGFGGSCENDNSGDPIVRFDAAAQRWVVTQVAVNGSGQDYECVAVSQTADATGSYYRYAFPFNALPDYPKLGVWPDAYYFSFDNFSLTASVYLGAGACAADRSQMLIGAAATMQCFQQNSKQFALLPSDLDGATPPAVGTPNFFMELDSSGSANLDLFKFHVDFTTPANSTFTGPTLIPIAPFTPLCNTEFRGRCIPQPTQYSDLLESVGDRLMYRLVYRNFGDHSTLLATHSVVAGSSGGIRWYEVRNPETAPTLFQSGTFAPDAQYRWMPSIAMDQNQDIAVGYSVSGTGPSQYPSIVYTGRMPADPLGTLESESVLVAGAGSQLSGGNRWGDYSSLTVDPTDDCTFWLTEEYLQSTGTNSGVNWSTAIGSFSFPYCGGSPNFSLSPSPNTVTILQDNSATSIVTIAPLNRFTGNVTLSVTGLPSGVKASFSPNPVTTTSALTLTAGATAATGTAMVTVTGTSGTLTSSTALSLTVSASNQSFSLSASPNAVTIVRGVGSGASTIMITPSNGFSGNVRLTTSKLPAGVIASFSPNPGTASSVLTLTAGLTAPGGTTSIAITGTSGSLSATTTITLTVSLANFTLTASPQTLTIPLGSSGNSTITINPTNNFNQSVTLSASGMPAGVTASFSPDPATSTSTLTLAVNGSAPTGATFVFITGTCGSLIQKTWVRLIIPKPSFTLTASPTTLTIPLGNSETSTITINPANNFNQTVILSASALPAGVTASFTPNAATSTSTLTLAVSGSAPIGGTFVEIIGTSGSLVQKVWVRLITLRPNFTLTASSPAMTLAQGSVGTSTITINPTNSFNQSVTLSASGLPAGITASFSPNPATSTSTLTLAASGSAIVRTTVIAIVGTSGGLTHTATVTVTVVAP